MIKINKVDQLHRNILEQLNKEQSHGTVLIYSDQCFHCAEMKPQWEEMKRKLHKTPANIYEINSNDLPYINHPIKNVVDGFPTILNLNDRNIMPFNEERTVDNFIRFVQGNAIQNTTNNINNNSKNVKKVHFNHLLENKRTGALKIGDSLDLDNYLDMKITNKKTKSKKKSVKKAPKKPKKSLKKKPKETASKNTKNKSKNSTQPRKKPRKKAPKKKAARKQQSKKKV